MFKQETKKQLLKNLPKVRTCRAAPCLPVYAMSAEITTSVDPYIEVRDFARGLFDQNIQKYRHLKANAIMAHLIGAWKQCNGESFIFSAKLINKI